MLISALAALLTLAALAPAPAQTAHPPTSARHQAAAKPRRPSRSHAQRAPTRAASGIGDGRALQIQQALLSAGYLSQTSGHWDAAARAAMTRYQKDHHWQTRYVPDARAIIALGLGPAMDGVPPTAAADNTAPDVHPDSSSAGR
ncbi:MAG TPA: peptidoglycan-binding protein [Terriglobales bacterium]|jgi:hypothetical protein